MPKGPITWTEDAVMAELESMTAIAEEYRSEIACLRAALERIDGLIPGAFDDPVRVMKAIAREALQQGHE